MSPRRSQVLAVVAYFVLIGAAWPLSPTRFLVVTISCVLVGGASAAYMSASRDREEDG